MREKLMKQRNRLILLLLGMMAIPLLFTLVERHPALFANTTLMGAILALQIALVGLGHFEEVFFPLLMAIFLWAGSFLPFYSTAMSLRWLFLGIGALGGFIIWIKRPRSRHFGYFHLVALFCVTSALISAAVSEVPRTALLKVCSLFLLFLYASAGARAAIAGREKQFVGAFVLACEAFTYLSAFCYFVLGFGVFGNPNSLGAVIGMVVIPVLLWAALAADTRGLKQRRFFALIVCCALLYMSSSRASILSAAVVFLVSTVALRRHRLLFQCTLISVFFFALMAVAAPSRLGELLSSVSGRIIYKEQGASHGVFGSRLSPWAETLSVVRRHPWVGSGFGTSELGDRRPVLDASSVYTTEGTNREHGSSYFALAEYMGILGVAPFALLILILIRALARVYNWIRKTRSPHHYCLPFALIVIAGLVHACFEDWLFAVGSYLCVLFWFSAFVLMDMIPEVERERSVALFHERPGLLASPVPLSNFTR
jgi:O-antigen ligase